MSDLESQLEFVRRLLLERGEVGVSAHELTYEHGITRTAARIFELRRRDHLDIETKREPGHQARYVLHRDRPPLKLERPEVPGQTTLLPDEVIPTLTYAELVAPGPLSWEELGDRLRADRRPKR